MPEARSALAAALAGRYRLDRELGQGGMATVYLAHGVKHHREVALKVLRPELATALGWAQQVVEAHFSPLAIFSRRAFTCAAISGSKSSGSHKGRISRSLGPGIGFGHRLAHSTASSIDRTCQTQ